MVKGPEVFSYLFMAYLQYSYLHQGDYVNGGVHLPVCL